MKLWIKILIGLAAGILVGLGIGLDYASIFKKLGAEKNVEFFMTHKKDVVHFLESLGKVFIDLLKMLVGIIIFSSLVSGVDRKSVV